jgi:hypothetical protein
MYNFYTKKAVHKMLVKLAPRMNSAYQFNAKKLKS